MNVNTILIKAAMGGFAADVQAALDAGAKVDFVGDHGYAAIHHAVLAGNPECVRVLCEAGADLELEGSDGLTAVQLAVKSRCFAAAKMLLQYDVDASVPYPDGSSVLHVAAAVGDELLMQMSVSRGANIHGCSRTGSTPINEAARHQQIGAVRWLNNAGAKLSHITAPLDGDLARAVAALRATQVI